VSGMKIQPVIIASTLAVLFTGCAGTSPTRVVGDTVGAAGGAAIGAALGHGSPIATAAGAAGGLLVSESLQAGSNAASHKSYDVGYEKGRSDTAKQQYQLLINQQRQPAGADEPVSLFKVPLPEREDGGAILEPSTRTLRIQE
jgi:hypothetical protein